MVNIPLLPDQRHISDVMLAGHESYLLPNPLPSSTLATLQHMKAVYCFLDHHMTKHQLHELCYNHPVIFYTCCGHGVHPASIEDGKFLYWPSGGNGGLIQGEQLTDIVSESGTGLPGLSLRKGYKTSCFVICTY